MIAAKQVAPANKSADIEANNLCYMEPRYETLPPRILVGQKLNMSLVVNKTGELFRSFMPRRKEIERLKDQIVYDLRVYPAGYFEPFNPSTPFDKWAVVEVDSADAIPEGMEVFHLVGGEYAVFKPANGTHGPDIFQYIFGQWMPSSNFILDERPHFERLDPKGIRNNPEADEEYWIPIKPRNGA